MAVKLNDWRLYVGLLLCLVLGGGLSLALVSWNATRAEAKTVEQYEQIKEGMSRAEVEKILGSPGKPHLQRNGSPDPNASLWDDSHLIITVIFDPEKQTVAVKSFAPRPGARGGIW